MLGGLGYFVDHDSAEDKMTLVGVLKHVAKHRCDIVSSSHLLEDKHLVEEAAQSRHNHLQLDRDGYLPFEASVGEVLFIGVLIVVDDAD